MDRLRGNGPQDRSLGLGRGQPREVGQNGVLEAQGLSREVQVPCAHGAAEAGTLGPPPGEVATRGPAKLRSPVGPHCSGSPLHRPGPRWPSVRPRKRKQTPPTFSSPPLSPSSTLQRARWGRGEESALGSRVASGSGVSGADQGDLRAKSERPAAGGAVYIYLAAV